MTKLAAALALVTALAGLAAGETYTLQPTDGSGDGYVVTADHAPVMTPGGVPALPRGTRLRVETRSGLPFEVFVVGPTALDHGCARRHWDTTVSQTGGYKLQFGRLGQAYLSQLDFVVSPDVARLAETTPYDYGFEAR